MNAHIATREEKDMYKPTRPAPRTQTIVRMPYAVGCTGHVTGRGPCDAAICPRLADPTIDRSMSVMTTHRQEDQSYLLAYRSLLGKFCLFSNA